MIKNNFRILKKQYAYLQTILKTPVKFQKDWPKTVGGVADTRMVVGADGRTDGRTDRQTDGRTDTQNFGGYNIIPRHFLVAGHKNELIRRRREEVMATARTKLLQNLHQAGKTGKSTWILLTREYNYLWKASVPIAVTKVHNSIATAPRRRVIVPIWVPYLR